MLYIYNVLLYIEGMKARKLYNRIATLRRDRGLSRHELAARIGVNHQTVGYLERGDYNPSLDLALRLSEVFVLPVEMIFSAQPLRPLSEELAARHDPEEEPWRGP
jgi:putative transcriptional regulator